MNRFSDRGSTPLGSTIDLHVTCYITKFLYDQDFDHTGIFLPLVFLLDTLYNKDILKIGIIGKAENFMIYQDKKLKEISDEFNISQSRISRIIQNALEKIKKEILKQEKLDENNF